MKKQPTQWLLSVLAVGMAGVIFSQSYTTAVASDNNALEVTPDQKLTTRQVAALLDRSHYLNQPLDVNMGKQIMQMYFDRLDPMHTLFLQSDIDELTQKYGDTYSDRLKQGDLRAGIEIFNRYRERSNEYYEYADRFLSSDVNLNTGDTIVLDREDASPFNTKAEQREYWAKQLTFQIISLTLGQEEDIAQDKLYLENPDLTRGHDLIKGEDRTPNEVLKNRLRRQHEQMSRLNGDEIMETILNTATLTYDPHSNYYAPIQTIEMQAQSNLQLEGIGVSIRPYRKNLDYTQIVTLVDGGPAQKSGQIKPNDLIIGVAKDGTTMQDVVGWSTREIVSLIRGPRGTDVVVKVKQPNAPESAARTVTITRDVIEQEDSGVNHRIINLPVSALQDPDSIITSDVLDDESVATKRIGVLEIPSFYLNYRARRSGRNYRSVSEDTRAALEALNNEGIDGLVVDLRNNPGGSLEEVARMLGLFIKEGPVVQIRDNHGNVEVIADPDGGKQLYSGKMVVLTNLGSASASEIFAAAIQDYGRGLVVGSTTTGKGSAQIQLDSLALGSATLTQRKFYRITGGSTQNKGVVPDIELVNIYEGADFDERSQKHALQWDTIKTSPYKPAGYFAQDTLQTLTEQSKIRQQNNPQFVYLETLNDIRLMEEDKKTVELNLERRREHMKAVETKTLAAENKRRIATDKKPYDNWIAYQAALEAEYEERSHLKDSERPKLPENEAYIIEAARLMLDAERLQNQDKHGYFINSSVTLNDSTAHR